MSLVGRHLVFTPEKKQKQKKNSSNNILKPQEALEINQNPLKLTFTLSEDYQPSEIHRKAKNKKEIKIAEEQETQPSHFQKQIQKLHSLDEKIQKTQQRLQIKTNQAIFQMQVKVYQFLKALGFSINLSDLYSMTKTEDLIYLLIEICGEKFRELLKQNHETDEIIEEIRKDLRSKKELEMAVSNVQRENKQLKFYLAQIQREKNGFHPQEVFPQKRVLNNRKENKKQNVSPTDIIRQLNKKLKEKDDKIREQQAQKRKLQDKMQNWIKHCNLLQLSKDAAKQQSQKQKKQFELMLTQKNQRIISLQKQISESKKFDDRKLKKHEKQLSLQGIC